MAWLRFSYLFGAHKDVFEEIRRQAAGRLLIPVVIAVVFVAIVKALFELRRSKLGERRDFLEILGAAARAG